MKHESLVSRQRVNLLLDCETVTQARELGINLSQAAGRALALEVKRERQRRWKEENRDWVAAYNAWFDVNGDPLADLTPL